MLMHKLSSEGPSPNTYVSVTVEVCKLTCIRVVPDTCCSVLYDRSTQTCTITALEPSMPDVKIVEDVNVDYYRRLSCISKFCFICTKQSFSSGFLACRVFFRLRITERSRAGANSTFFPLFHLLVTVKREAECNFEEDTNPICNFQVDRSIEQTLQWKRIEAFGLSQTKRPGYDHTTMTRKSNGLKEIERPTCSGSTAIKETPGALRLGPCRAVPCL